MPLSRSAFMIAVVWCSVALAQRMAPHYEECRLDTIFPNGDSVVPR